MLHAYKFYKVLFLVLPSLIISNILSCFFIGLFWFDLVCNMVRNYMKETNEANINENGIAAAINDINNGNCSIISAAAEYGIHFATLQYRLGL